MVNNECVSRTGTTWPKDTVNDCELNDHPNSGVIRAIETLPHPTPLHALLAVLLQGGQPFRRTTHRRFALSP